MREALVRAGSQGIRAWGTATANLRPCPDFLLIGGKRAGTTSLYYAALTNPQILPLFPGAKHLPKRNNTKGVHFFDSNFEKGESWYRGHFPSRWSRSWAERRLAGPVVVGDGSPYYLFHPLAPQRAAAMLPGVKIVVTLRDPTSRTYSHWKEQRRNGIEKLDFAQALSAESGRLEGEEERILSLPGYRSFAHENQSYATQSDYKPMLERWLSHYSRDQILILVSEDFNSHPQQNLDELARFLGVAPVKFSDTGGVWNAAKGPPFEPELGRELAERFAETRSYVSQLLDRKLPWLSP